MANDRVRLQVKSTKDPEKWEDVGADAVGVPVPVYLETGDIEIGAVEIKDGTTDTRAVVSSTTGLEVADVVANSLVPAVYDYIVLTYVAAGNGAGEIETAIFKTGGAGGTTVSTLTLAYDASDNLISVTKT